MDEDIDESDKASFQQIATAAERIIDVCVGTQAPNRGGYVENLGMLKFGHWKLLRLFMPMSLSTPRPSHIVVAACTPFHVFDDSVDKDFVPIFRRGPKSHSRRGGIRTGTSCLHKCCPISSTTLRVLQKPL